MACTSCTDTTPCGTPDCGCKFEVDAGCVRYSGESLGAAGIVEGDTLATILETLNTKFETYGPGDYVDVVDEAAGSNCAFGGLKFILYSGLDNTVKETKYICGIGAASFLNGTGTANRIPKFLDTDTLGDSIMSESGSVITIDGTIKLTGGTPGLGKVLTSDADGDASWATPSSGGIALTDLSGASPITYNNLTGAIGIQAASATQNGYLTSADWITFNSAGGGDLMKNGSVALTNNWNAGAYTITSNKLVSTIDATIHGLTVGQGAGTGTDNSAFGYLSLSNNTTGSYNTAIGSNSLSGVNTGNANTAIGHLTMNINTTGTANTAVGQGALPDNTTGSNNVSIGRNSLLQNSTGSSNTAIGRESLDYNTTGSNNTALGSKALSSVLITSDNVGIGYQAGSKDFDGIGDNYNPSSCIYIGSNSKSFGFSNTNEIVIGNSAVGNGSNTATIGNTSTLNAYLHGNFNLKNATAPTTAAVTQTKWLPVTINGVSYKLLLAD